MKSFIALLFVVTVNALAAAPNFTPRKHFIGCVRSVGECVHSCPQRKAAWEVDATKCNPQDYYERLACYCIRPSSDRLKK